MHSSVVGRLQLALVLSIASPIAFSQSAEPNWKALYANLNPSVVTVKVTTKDGAKSGTGFLVLDNEHVCTCFHVVKDAIEITVTTSRKTSVSVSRVAFVKESDVCVLELADKMSSAPIQLSPSGDFLVGEPVATIGTPLGILESTLSTGIVSAKRTFNGINAIQTTVSISPGCSGSPLINGKSQVLGMMTSSISGDNAQQLNFAVPSSEIRKALDSSYVGVGSISSSSGSKQSIPTPVAGSESDPKSGSDLSEAEALRNKERASALFVSIVSATLRAYNAAIIRLYLGDVNPNPQLALLEADAYYNVATSKLIAQGSALFGSSDSKELLEALFRFRRVASNYCFTYTRALLIPVEGKSKAEWMKEVDDAVNPEEARFENAYAEVAQFSVGKTWYLDKHEKVSDEDSFLYSRIVRLRYKLDMWADPEFPGRCAIGFPYPDCPLKRGDIIVAARKQRESGSVAITSWQSLLDIGWDSKTGQYVDIVVKTKSGNEYLVESRKTRASLALYGAVNEVRPGLKSSRGKFSQSLGQSCLVLG